MKHSRVILVEAMSDAAARDGDDCATFNARPVLVNQVTEDLVALKAISKQFKVINTLSQAVNTGERHAIAQDISGFWVTVSGGGFWEILAVMRDTPLLATDTTGTADFIHVRFGVGGSCLPPDVGGDGEGEESLVTFNNPWGREAECDALVVLRWVDPTCDEDPVAPGWEIVETAAAKARWIKFRYSAESPSLITELTFWEGYDPQSCGQSVTIEYPLGAPCEDADVVACYKPETDSYVALDTKASMLGEPEDLDVINAIGYDDVGCAINYVRQSIKAFPCGSEPEFTSTEPTLDSVDVITSATLVPPVAECTGYAEYTWNPGTYVWDLTTPCASGCVSTPPSGIPDDPGVAGSPVPSPCSNAPGNPASPGYLSFAKSSILVCSATSISGSTIQLVECPPAEGY